MHVFIVTGLPAGTVAGIVIGVVVGIVIIVAIITIIIIINRKRVKKLLNHVFMHAYCLP